MTCLDTLGTKYRIYKAYGQLTPVVPCGRNAAGEFTARDCQMGRVCVPAKYMHNFHILQRDVNLNILLL